MGVKPQRLPLWREHEVEVRTLFKSNQAQALYEIWLNGKPFIEQRFYSKRVAQNIADLLIYINALERKIAAQRNKIWRLSNAPHRQQSPRVP